MRWFALRAVTLVATLGCAETTAPLPPPAEYLVAVAPGAGGLSITSLAGDRIPFLLLIGDGMRSDVPPITSRGLVLASYAEGDSIAVVDLVRRTVSRRLSAGPGAGALGGTWSGDSVAWVALSGRDAILRVNVSTGDTVSAPAGRTPVGIVQARGRLFVVNANSTDCASPAGTCPAGPSWVTVHDATSGSRLGDRDSIPLPGPGNARSAVVGADGRVYVMSVGGTEDPLGRLTIIDPVNRIEAGSFGGFGAHPGQIAADRGERILVSSTVEGLMEFNTRMRAVVRGAGAGIPIAGNTGVAVGGNNYVFAIEGGDCAAGTAGRVREFRPDLTEAGAFSVGTCAGAAATALIPSETIAALR
jgi:hypothetical protein